MLLNNFGGEGKNQYFDHRESQRFVKRLKQHHTFCEDFLKVSAARLHRPTNKEECKQGARRRCWFCTWNKCVFLKYNYTESSIQLLWGYGNSSGVCWRNLFTSAPPHMLHTRAGTPDVAYSLGQMHCTDSMWQMQSPAHALNTLARTFCLCPMSSLIPVTNFPEVQILGLRNAACSVRNPTLCKIKPQRKASRMWVISTNVHLFVLKLLLARCLIF